jgi:iron complex transport system substrate-binding protein
VKRAPSPRRSVDGLGRSIVLPRRIDRIVTLAPNLTEIVYAVGAGGKIAGTDDASNFPEPARQLPKVGAMQPNVEKIALLKPDLVIASTEGNHPSLEPALKAAGIPLFVVKTDRVFEIATSMRTLGRILQAKDAEAAAAALERSMEGERRVRANNPRVLFAVWTDPLYVAGRDTFTDDLLRLTGAQNAVQVRGWPQYSLEALVQTPPDLILYPRGAITPEQMEAFIKRVPGVRARVVAVDEDIFQRPGPRMAEAAKALNAILDE